MPKGRIPKREAKKPKKKAKAIAAAPLPDFSPPQVEVVGKRRRPKDAEV